MYLRTKQLKMKNLSITIIFTLISIISFGQDKIVKKDLTEILCKVSEIGTSEIKYNKWDNLEGPLYTIKKSEVLKIVFANGTVELIEQNEMSVVPSKNRNYKRAFTTRPFSLLGGHLCLGYQQAVTPSQAMIFEIGLIGPSVGTLNNKANGGYFRAGYRLKRSPEVVMEGQEWGHNLGGVYIQPEIAYSNFNRTSTNTNWQTGTTSTDTYNYSSGAFLITLGRQIIAGDIMTFDVSTSFGYAFTTTDRPTNSGFDTPRYYSHMAFGQDSPFAFNFGISMGFLAK